LLADDGLTNLLAACDNFTDLSATIKLSDLSVADRQFSDLPAASNEFTGLPIALLIEPLGCIEASL
jgi:hypothetical protein